MFMVQLWGIHPATGEEVVFSSPTFPDAEEARAFVTALVPEQAYNWIPINALPLPED